jgi:molecular chaperone Hsp33
MTTDTDTSRRFTLDKLDIRGQLVQLGDVWQTMHQQRGYPENILHYLGELCCVAVLLGAGLKHRGRAALQVQPRRKNDKAQLPLAVVDCTDALGVRGMANKQVGTEAETFAQWVDGGTLAMTLLNANTNQMYQSIVPVSGLSVAECFEQYFDLSEQLPTHLWLAANQHGAGALLLQKLPNADVKDADGWARVEQLAASVSDEELIDLPAERLLARLFAGDDVRLYDSTEVSNACQRDAAKVEAMLISLGRNELEATLAEQGIITVTDDICNQVYSFDADAVKRLFAI